MLIGFRGKYLGVLAGFSTGLTLSSQGPVCLEGFGSWNFYRGGNENGEKQTFRPEDGRDTEARRTGT